MTDLFQQPLATKRGGHKRKELGMDKYYLLMDVLKRWIAEGKDVSCATVVAAKLSNSEELPFPFNDAHVRHALRCLHYEPPIRSKKPEQEPAPPQVPASENVITLDRLEVLYSHFGDLIQDMEVLAKTVDAAVGRLQNLTKLLPPN